MSGWRAALDDPRDQLHFEIHACWGEEGGGGEEDVSRVRQVALGDDHRPGSSHVQRGHHFRASENTLFPCNVLYRFVSISPGLADWFRDTSPTITCI
jgi:hypothetical protein